ncbi:DUF3179 domain-containing protein [Candidatus Poribacteria bacterium]|nr:DUF3179 domain-containing protein [Candidatus Poribacteria bacterium]
MYSRELDGKTYTFGVSGKLWRDALLMYDHQTRSLWSHITGEAIQGKLKGKKLKPLTSIPQIEWKTWMENYPNTKVLSVFVRGSMRESISRDSYERYHTSKDTGVSGTKYTDDRLPNKSLVVGVQVQVIPGADGIAGHAGADGQPGAAGQDGADGGVVELGDSQRNPKQKQHQDSGNTSSRAYPLTQFTKNAFINDSVKGVPLLIFHDKESFATAVFKRIVNNKAILFTSIDGYIAHDNTGTEWNLITGKATSGKYKGKRLERLSAVNIYWFAWARFYPETTIYKP